MKYINFHRLFAACLGLLAAMSFSSASADIFLSYSGFGVGNANNDFIASHTIGDTGSLFVWITDDENMNTGIDLNISSSDTAIARFTGSTVSNPDILNAALADVNDRWAFTDGGVVTDSLVDGLRGFNLTGLSTQTGILSIQTTGNDPFDSFHDPLSNAFLYGTIDYEIVGNGTADFEIATGDLGVAHDGVLFTPTYAGASVVVSAVPEPSSMIALGVLAGAVALRRRKRSN